MKKITKRQKMMIKRRRFILFMTLLLIVTCCGFSSAKNNVTPSNDGAYISVYVTPGDTLWSIAQKNNPENKELRSHVREIQKYNKLASSTIHAGDEIIIPLN